MNSTLADVEPAAVGNFSGVKLRSWVTLGLLSIAFFFCLLDRQILTVLVEPVKRDLAMSDTQFGLVQGMAFAVFYVLFAVPVATLSDRWNRKAVVSGGLFLWSASTCLAGFARSFGALFGARIGVGIGEACLAPAAYSMLTDLFGPKTLGRVIGIFHAVGALGIAGSVAIGGSLHGYFTALGSATLLGVAVPPWGLVLVTVGVPGIVLALVIFVVVAEPLRSAPAATPPSHTPPADAKLLAALLADRGAFMRLIIGSCVMAIAGNALLTWAPAYLMRSFELTPAQAGGRLGIAFAIGAVIGPLLGGAISDRLFKRHGNAGPMLVLIACSAATAVCYAMLPFAASVLSAASLIATVSIFYSAVLSVSASAIQQRAPAGLRARISALWLCLNTLVGLGLGSLLVGVVTDYVFGTPSAVGASLACVAFAASVVGGAFIATLLKRRT